MKPRIHRLAILVIALAATPLANATVYYWDNTITMSAAGFGTAGGTWGSDSKWSTSNAGTAATGISAPTTSDDLNFGYTTTGLAAGTVNVTGTVNAQSLTFASGSGAITLSGGTAINLAAAATITVNNASDTIPTAITGAATSLTKAGSGTLTLSGANTYAGTTTVNAGTLLTTKAAALPGYNSSGKVVFNGGTVGVQVGGSGWTTAQVDTLLTNATKTSGALGIDTTNGDLTQWTAFTTTNFGSALGLTKLGSNTLTLSNTNTYTGTTSITGGTLLLSGGDNRLLSTGTVSFAGGNGSSATLDIGANSQTLASITIPTVLTATSSMTGTIKGIGGTLTLNGAADLNLGPTLSTTTGITGLTTIDMSNLSNFVYNASGNTFRVGLVSSNINGATSADEYSALTLAKTSNTITAANFDIGDQGGSSGGGISRVHLGTANTLNVANIHTGDSGRSSVYLDFASGLTSPTLTIRNTDGTSAVTSWTVGSANTFGPAAANQVTWTQSVDLSAGTVDANVTTLTIGKDDISSQTSRVGTANASFSLGATNHGGGDFTVGTLNLGWIAGTSLTGVNINSTYTTTLAANGTFTLNNANGVLNATTITFATNKLADNQTGNTKTVSGTFNLTDGTLNATAIQKGVQTGTASATIAFNWANGTIANIAGGNLAITGIPITLSAGTHTFNATSGQTISLDAYSGISGSGYGITKDGAGTLTLSGTNTYTGTTQVTGGILKLAASSTNNISSSTKIIVGDSSAHSSATLDVTGLTSGTLALTGSQTLGGHGTVTGGVTAASGSHISPGNGVGILSVTSGLTYADSSIFDWEIDRTKAQTRGTGYDAVNVTGTLTGLDGADANTTFDAKFRIIIGDSNFSDPFWKNTRSWSDIFTESNGSTVKTNWASIFGGGFEYYKTDGTQLTAPDAGTVGYFTFNGSNNNTLTWTAVPEPTSALVGLLIGAGLLRRRRTA